jgi:radical SAM protein with 4Fe4S-binding SPASM domain
VVCLIDPVGDVYACPFTIHEEFLAGNVREVGGFTRVWRDSALFRELRAPQTTGACTSCEFFDSCRGGCMAAKFFTGLPLDGPDPECVKGFGEAALAERGQVTPPRPAQDHSRLPGGARMLPLVSAGPARACNESPLVGLHSG